jgi:uncharacterized protein YqeY
MLRTRLSDELKLAVKDKDDYRKTILRLILAALKDRDIAAKSKGCLEGINDNEIIEMLQTMVKQRIESTELYHKGGRMDLAQRESRETDVIRSFLPEPLTQEETETAVQRVIADTDASGPKDMGRIMAALRKQYAGRMDFKVASNTVKAHLGQAPMATDG